MTYICMSAILMNTDHPFIGSPKHPTEFTNWINVCFVVFDIDFEPIVQSKRSKRKLVQFYADEMRIIRHTHTERNVIGVSPEK